MTARTELEQDALHIATALTGNPIASLETASERASAFNWVNAVGDYQCPSCWVTDGHTSQLHAAASTLATEAHFECPACGYHFVEQS